jgi:hypothetical protein
MADGLIDYRRILDDRDFRGVAASASHHDPVMLPAPAIHVLLVNGDACGDADRGQSAAIAK